MTASPSKLLTQEQVQQVNATLAAAADGSLARVVPVVASSSSRYERSEDLLGLWASALGLALVWWLVATHHFNPHETDSGAAVAGGLLLVLAVVATGFILGGLLAARIGWLKRLFISRRQLQAAVRDRAEQLFSEYRFRGRESGRPIVLLYVSVYEKGVEIMADADLSRQLSDEALEPIRQIILEAIGQPRLAEALCQAIGMLRDLLAAVCPPDAEQHEREEVPLLRVIE